MQCVDVNDGVNVMVCRHRCNSVSSFIHRRICCVIKWLDMLIVIVMLLVMM